MTTQIARDQRTGRGVTSAIAITTTVMVWLISLLLTASLVREGISSILLASNPAGTMCELPQFCATTGAAETPVPISAVASWPIYVSAVASLTMAALLVVATVLGTRVLSRIGNNRAFAESTTRSLAWASGLHIGGGIASYILGRIANSEFMTAANDYFMSAGSSSASVTVGFKPGVPALAVVIGVLGFAVWAALRQGRALQEDLDGLI